MDGSFDVAIMFEAIYYLADPEQFLEECRRVLVPGGTLLLSTANREWTGFTSSALATRYLSASELSALLARHGFSATVLGPFRLLRTGAEYEGSPGGVRQEDGARFRSWCRPLFTGANSSSACFMDR